MKRMVTRTIELNTYTVRTMDIDTAEVLDVDYTVGTSYKPGDILKQLRAEHETDVFKLVAVVNHTTETRLYGMDEQTFINHAVVLPPRTKADPE